MTDAQIRSATRPTIQTSSTSPGTNKHADDVPAPKKKDSRSAEEFTRYTYATGTKAVFVPVTGQESHIFDLIEPSSTFVAPTEHDRTFRIRKDILHRTYHGERTDCVQMYTMDGSGGPEALICLALNEVGTQLEYGRVFLVSLFLPAQPNLVHQPADIDKLGIHMVKNVPDERLMLPIRIIIATFNAKPGSAHKVHQIRPLQRPSASVVLLLLDDLPHLLWSFEWKARCSKSRDFRDRQIFTMDGDNRAWLETKRVQGEAGVMTALTNMWMEPNPLQAMPLLSIQDLWAATRFKTDDEYQGAGVYPCREKNCLETFDRHQKRLYHEQNDHSDTSDVTLAIRTMTPLSGPENQFE
ncbi:hypothetical protein DL98DRAFT_598143 [Cadophora sp. DSE1049]|nr:hypothetical protein DL98DRAFT_598143 [Cadophora sp. DSE1049]